MFDDDVSTCHRLNLADGIFSSKMEIEASCVNTTQVSFFFDVIFFCHSLRITSYDSNLNSMNVHSHIEITDFMDYKSDRMYLLPQ